jgi:hypothetical protein
MRYLADRDKGRMTALIAEVQIKKATIEKLMGSNGRFKSTRRKR